VNIKIKKYRSKLMRSYKIRNATLSLIILLLAANIKLMSQQSIRFAVIGDFGWAGQPELDVSNLVKSWNPDFIITTGDNNYDYGADSTIDRNIGQYYHQFISPYKGSYGTGDTINRFFPTLGNHDWNTPGAIPYLNYFTLPNNERYYDFIKGPVHFFAIDSDPHEPDGTSSSSTQANWLKNKLSSSTSRWNIVYFHHPPYSSGTKHGSTTGMRWPFRQWGAHAVLSGHEHNYERLIVDSLVYLVNGAGGKNLYTLGTPIAGSIVRYDSNHGAQLVTANSDSINFKFYSRTGALIDAYTIISSSKSIKLNLQRGWNLLSLPIKVSDPLKSSIFPDAISPAFIYEANQYNITDSLGNGFGFWIKFNISFDAYLIGDSLYQDTIDVNEGWNLIGSISTPVPTNSVIQIPDQNITSSFFGFDGSYYTQDTLLPGKGYWVKANQPGKLVLLSQ